MLLAERATEAMTAEEGRFKIFVGGLSHETTDLSLLEYFQSFGTVLSAVVLRDSETLSSRGFGFVTFASKDTALQCIDLGKHLIDNKYVETKSAFPRRFSSSSSSPQEVDKENLVDNKVFVGGLLYATDARKLKEYFGSFGEVESSDIIYNKDTKVSRGFGFVRFKSRESVDRVLHFQESGQRHKVDGKRVEVKRCVKKTEPQSVVRKTSERMAKAASPSKSRSRVTSFAQAAAIGTRFEKEDFEFPEVHPSSCFVDSLLKEENIDLLQFSRVDNNIWR